MTYTRYAVLRYIHTKWKISMRIKPGIYPEYFTISEVTDGMFFGQEILKRKLAVNVQDFGRHVIAFYKHNPKHITPLGYQHIAEYETVALLGGGSVDGLSFKDIPEEVCDDLRRKGGVLYLLLTHVFREYADLYEAFFGFCGDARAEQIDLRAGFNYTGIPMLLAKYREGISEDRKQELLDSVVKLGSNFDGIYEYNDIKKDL